MPGDKGSGSLHVLVCVICHVPERERCVGSLLPSCLDAAVEQTSCLRKNFAISAFRTNFRDSALFGPVPNQFVRAVDRQEAVPADNQASSERWSRSALRCRHGRAGQRGRALIQRTRPAWATLWTVYMWPYEGVTPDSSARCSWPHERFANQRLLIDTVFVKRTVTTC